jgi:hypothetical protein
MMDQNFFNRFWLKRHAIILEIQSTVFGKSQAGLTLSMLEMYSAVTPQVANAKRGQREKSKGTRAFGKGPVPLLARSGANKHFKNKKPQPAGSLTEAKSLMHGCPGEGHRYSGRMLSGSQSASFSSEIRSGSATIELSQSVDQIRRLNRQLL